MAQELLKVKLEWKSGAQIVSHELDQIDDQLRILDLESQKVQESLAFKVAERLGDPDERQARHEAVTCQLHESVPGTKA